MYYIDLLESSPFKSHKAQGFGLTDGNRGEEIEKERGEAPV